MTCDWWVDLPTPEDSDTTPQKQCGKQARARFHRDAMDDEVYHRCATHDTAAMRKIMAEHGYERVSL